MKIELPIDEIVRKYENGTSIKELGKEYYVSESTIYYRIKKYYEESKVERKSLKRESTRIELPIDEIVRKYENGISIEDLGKEYWVSFDTVNRRINEYYKEAGIERPYKSARIELPIEEIIKKYENGTNVKNLGKEYNVSESTINNRIKEYYAETKIERPVKKVGKKKIKLPIEEIVKKYENRTSMVKLGKEYSVSGETINSRINEYYEERKIERPNKSTRIELPVEEIVKRYENGDRIEDIAKEYNVSEFTINRRIKEYYEERGLERPFQKTGNKKIKLPIEEIVKRYENGDCIENIAKEYETSYANIDRRIKEYYKEKGEKAPRILRSSSVVQEYLKKGLTKEEIIQIALKKNIIIPQKLIDAEINNKDINDDEER